MLEYNYDVGLDSIIVIALGGSALQLHFKFQHEGEDMQKDRDLDMSAIILQKSQNLPIIEQRYSSASTRNCNKISKCYQCV